MLKPRGGLHVLFGSVVLLVLAIAVSWVPAATPVSRGVYGGHATLLNYAYPEVWDPHIAGTLGALAAISPLYNQVVEFNPLKPDEVIGDLAASWEVTDGGLTYIFHLHERITWWDGKDLTADDVAFSLNRMIEPGKPRPRVGLLRPMTKSAEAIDRNTVRVRLNYPSPSFLQFLAVDYMKVVPKHLLDAGVDINVWENIVGSGPFKIKGARRGDSVTYEKNPTYFKKGRPYLDGLTVVAIVDKGTAAAAIKAGKIVMTTGATSLGVDDVLKLEQDLKGKYTLYWQPVTAGQHIFANVEREPWKDLRIIKALRLATDQQEIQKAFGGGKYSMGAPFPPDSWYGSTAEELLKRPGYRRAKDKDIEEAKALLKEAGYDPPSKLGRRVLTTTTAVFHPDLAQLWAAQMRRNLGLEIEVKLVDTPTGVNTFVAGDFDLGIWGYAYNIADPDDWVNAVYGPGARNYTRWKNPEFLKMFDQQSRELDRDKRRQILRRMEELLLTVEDPYITAPWVPWFYLVSDKVRTEAGSFTAPNTIQ
ncbi:MAG: ABC transporter substrate-binding protein, partial [Nitrospinae bacterium]|nr:ABC transporter substrate-binding protein [Nitrospinota bacterium]